jgi:myo-inositol 2-dehydrogenase/D-chiro-inositol 1-dehydrogenase
MKQLALIGAGRIGKVHALAIDSIKGVTISHVCDVHQPSAESLARQCDAAVANTDEVFSNTDIDAVIIASATDTHTPLIKQCAEAGKPVFCEKPLDLSLATAREAAEAIERSGILCGMGFNRRFDPQFSKLKQRVSDGDIGQLESLIIISRDPAPPPIEYIHVSGGLFRDMMIHDFDIARWIIDEPIATVFAAGSCLVDPAIAGANDIDTACVTLQTESGKQAVITNSRRAVYGYDQRIEAFGSNGMLQAMNNADTNLVHSGKQGITSEVPLHFFLERYETAYRNELLDFADALQNNRKPLADHHDGVASLQLAEAASASLQSGSAVRVDQF